MLATRVRGEVFVDAIDSADGHAENVFVGHLARGTDEQESADAEESTDLNADRPPALIGRSPRSSLVSLGSWTHRSRTGVSGFAVLLTRVPPLAAKNSERRVLGASLSRAHVSWEAINLATRVGISCLLGERCPRSTRGQTSAAWTRRAAVPGAGCWRVVCRPSSDAPPLMHLL